MFTKPALLIGVLALLAIVLVSFAFIRNQQRSELFPQPVTQQPRAVSPTIVPPSTELYFEPEVLDTQGTSETVTVMANTNSNLLTAAQVELKYDPSILSNVKITTPGEDHLFGPKGEYLVLFSEIDTKVGKISYAVGISPASKSRGGIGPVMTLTFTKRANTPETVIEFLPISEVAQADSANSVLKSTQNLIVR